MWRFRDPKDFLFVENEDENYQVSFIASEDNKPHNLKFKNSCELSPEKYDKLQNKPQVKDITIWPPVPNKKVRDLQAKGRYRISIGIENSSDIYFLCDDILGLPETKD